MSMPLYISPEQMMQDRAEFAKKGIAKGRSVIVASTSDGVILVADNPSHNLHKISEIYDKIGFAAVGRYNEFENLRIAGIRYADLRGYSYDRADVNARGLANSYAQQLGLAFAGATEKPYEVELLIAQVGETVAEDEIFQISYDGTIADHRGCAVIGGRAEPITRQLETHDFSVMTTSQALVVLAGAMSEAASLEVAVLDRVSNKTRRFRRLTSAKVAVIVGGAGA